VSGEPRPGALLVLCGDWDGVDRCGVAHSERALLADGPDCVVVDPLDLRRSAAALWQARRRDEPVLLVYPTRSTVARWTPLATFALAALLRRRDDLRLHLHEYRIFREVRWALGAVLLLGGPTVVVSSESERARLALSLAGRLRRARPTVVPPFGPLTPAATGATAVDAAGSGTVGVFGFAGPAKGTERITEALRALPPSYRRLELVGSGWDAVAWPADVTDRFEVVAHGFVPTAALGSIFAGWELALAPFATGATDGRSSLRIPLAHGIPTLTNVEDPADLTVGASHLVVVGNDVAGAVERACALAADPAARRRGADEMEAFERRVGLELRRALLPAGDGR
jgi:hypothetical protein